MKRLSLCLLCLSSGMVAASPITLEPTVTDVVLFPQQAQITRSGLATLPAGRHTLEITNLPELDLDRLQLDLPGVSISGVRQGITALPKDISERRASLQAEIAALEKSNRQDRDADRLDQQHIEQLMTLLGQPAQGGWYAQIPAAQWPQAWQRVRDDIDQRQVAIQTRAEKVAEREREIAALTRQLEQLGQPQQRRTSLMVDVSTARDIEAPLTLTYLTRQASWSNQLQLDLLTDTQEVEMSAMARIVNRTGEDWQDVALTLALMPAGYRQLPSPQPWLIDIAKPEPAQRPHARALMAESASADMAKADVLSPAITQHGVDMRAALGNHNLPSDGGQLLLPYLSEQQSVSMQREAHLWAHPNVMLVGEWKNESNLWLPGALTVMRDGQRLSQLHRRELIQPGETLRMAFGDDPRIELTRTQLPVTRGESGIIQRQSTQRRDTNVTLRSAHSQPIDVVVYDRLPVAQDDRITVKHRGDRPAKQDVDGVSGLLMWTMSLEPEAEATLRTGHEILFPRDERLQGL